MIVPRFSIVHEEAYQSRYGLGAMGRAFTLADAIAFAQQQTKQQSESWLIYELREDGDWLVWEDGLENRDDEPAVPVVLKGAE